MKKLHYFFIVPILLLGSMNVSAQTETSNNISQAQIKALTTLEKARENYAISLDNSKKATSTSRAENAKFQSILADSKEQFRNSLEIAISGAANQDLKTALEAELATLISSN